jgi:sterol desaturase/sphingolipid hydroxylase (fatty acid hydroxylase superfamily)
MLDFLLLNQHDVMFIALMASIILLLILESVIPRRKQSFSMLSRWSSNLGLALLNFFLLSFVAVYISSSGWVSSIQISTPLLQYLDFNLFSQFIVVIVVFEFIDYCLHRLMHVVPGLWRIHAVHHCDTSVDVTTANRHHFLEPLFTLVFTIPLIVLLGPSVYALVLFNLLFIIAAAVTHANILLPEKFDRWLRYFVVTPDFHRLHHSSKRQFTDSNYSTIFPWFDYIFATATKVPFDKQNTMELGLSYFRKDEDSRMDRLLLLPFFWKK